MARPILGGLNVVARDSQIDASALFHVGNRWDEKSFVVSHRKGANVVPEMQYQLARAVHQIAVAESLSEDEEKAAIQDALYRSARIWPDYFAQ